MKKIILCNITMKEQADRCVYTTTDPSLSTSDRGVIYPINAFLEKNLEKEDEIKAILLVKKDTRGNYQKNAAAFVEELLAVNEGIGAKIEFSTIETDFSQSQTVHESLLQAIVDALTEGAHILADITYGPKDLPIVLFTALSFAERFLSCEIDHLIYGQVEFQDGKPTAPKLCDMIPLYYLNSVTSTIRCEDPTRAKQMLKALLSL